MGTDADTGQFVVGSVRRWWRAVGGTAYPNAKRVLITADSGGSWRGRPLESHQVLIETISAVTGSSKLRGHCPRSGWRLT